MKVEKRWRLKAIIDKNKTTSRVLNHKPTEDDVKDFAITIASKKAKIVLEIFWEQHQ